MLFRVHLQPLVVDARDCEEAKAKAALHLYETGTHLLAELAKPGETPTLIPDPTPLQVMTALLFLFLGLLIPYLFFR